MIFRISEFPIIVLVKIYQSSNNYILLKLILSFLSKFILAFRQKSKNRLSKEFFVTFLF